MTVQIPDTISLTDCDQPLFSKPWPFDPRSEMAARIRFVAPSSAMWSGYVARWRDSERKLYLVDLLGNGIIEGTTPPEVPVRPADWMQTQHMLASTSLRRTVDGRRPYPIDLAAIHGTSDPVFADWLTMPLFVPHGNMSRRDLGGYGVVPSHFREITVEQGCIMGEEIVRNFDKLPRGPDRSQRGRTWRQLRSFLDN